MATAKQTLVNILLRDIQIVCCVPCDDNCVDALSPCTISSITVVLLPLTADFCENAVQVATIRC